MKNQEECICALATPAGGAIRIIRLSGSDAITLTDKIFQSANGKSLEEAKPYTLHYGEIKDKDGNTINNQYIPAREHAFNARMDYDHQFTKNYGLNIGLSGRYLSGVENVEYKNY